MRHVIALDVGGTGMKAALAGPEGEVLHRARRATGRAQGPDAVVAGILDFAAELHAYGTEHFGTPAAAAGVAVPGIVDEARGVGRDPADPGGGGGPRGAGGGRPGRRPASGAGARRRGGRAAARPDGGGPAAAVPG
ncbi:ROK family protein, partial [Streptomyces olindensis]